MLIRWARVADQFAANEYFVVMPDLFPGDLVPLNLPGTFDLMAWLRGPPGHLPERVDPVVESVLRAMRDSYKCKAIAGVGHCFGAKYPIRKLRPSEALSVGYVCTPLMVEPWESRNIVAPLSIAAAEKDAVFPQREKDRNRADLTVADELSQPYQMTLYGHVEHGFGCKADITVQENKFAKEQAVLQAVVWLNKYMKS